VEMVSKVQMYGSKVASIWGERGPTPFRHLIWVRPRGRRNPDKTNERRHYELLEGFRRILWAKDGLLWGELDGNFLAGKRGSEEGSEVSGGCDKKIVSDHFKRGERFVGL